MMQAEVEAAEERAEVAEARAKELEEMMNAKDQVGAVVVRDPIQGTAKLCVAPFLQSSGTRIFSPECCAPNSPSFTAPMLTYRNDRRGRPR